MKKLAKRRDLDVRGREAQTEQLSHCALLGLQTVAKLLGISRATLRQLALAGRFPAPVSYEGAGRWKFRAAVVAAWIKGETASPAAENHGTIP